MEYWLSRGFTLKFIGPKTYVVSKPGKHAVVVEQWDQSLQKDSEWFKSERQATVEAYSLLSTLVTN